MPTLLSSPPSKSSMGQVTVCRSSLQKMACPISPLFFCSFFCSKSSVIHVFAVYDARSPCRELWFCLKTHTALPQTVNSVEVSTPNWWKCLLGYLGGFLVQGLFEFESWSNPERAWRPPPVGYVGDTIYNFSSGSLVFLSLFPHISIPSLSHHTVAFLHFLMSSGAFFSYLCGFSL